MEKSSNSTSKINTLERTPQLEQLLNIIHSSGNDNVRLENLKKLSRKDFSKYDLLSELKELALFDNNDEIRFETAKIIYKNYPQKSKDILKYILLHDQNYNVPFIDLIEQERYNFNDLINISMERQIKKEKMVNNVIDTELLSILLNWRNLIDQFKISYEVNLGFFIASHRFSKLICHICSSKYDPFFLLKFNGPLPISYIHDHYEPVFKIYERCFENQYSLRFLKVSKVNNELDIQGKVINSLNNILIYLG